MTAADFTGPLSDALLSAATAIEDADIEGVERLALTGAAVVTPLKQRQCGGCAQWPGTHKTFRRLTVDADAGQEKIWQEPWIDAINDLHEWTMRVQSLIQLLHRAAHSIYETTRVVGYANSANELGQWEIQNADGTTLTLLYQSGDQNPAAFAWTDLSVNPDYLTDPLEPRLLTTNNESLLPARGVVTFSGSLLKHHGGIIVKKITCDPDIAPGETFEMELEGDCSAADTVWPASSTDPLIANYRFYAATKEPWVQPRRIFPLWVRPRTYEVASGSFPGDSVFNLQSGASADCRIKNPTQNGEFSCEIKAGGVWLDYTATVRDGLNAGLSPRLKIFHSGGGYKTTADLSGLLTGATDVRFVYWYEDTGSDLARWMGQNRCAYSIEEPTGSWGTDEGGASKFYCAKGTAATGIANFRPQCYQRGVCNQFAEDSPSNALGQSLWDQLFLSLPWKITQLLAGYIYQRLERWGCPSLAALAEINTDTPSGFHPLVGYPQIGGWPICKAQAGLGSLQPIKGFEILALNDDLSAPDMDSATKPSYGAAGGNYTATRLADYGSNVTLSDSNDPDRIQRAMATASSRDLVPYEGTLLGDSEWGQHQRVGHFQHTYFFPRLASGDGLQERLDGDFERGGWSAALVDVGGGGSPAYHWKVTLNAGLRGDKTRDEGFGGLKFEATIAAAGTDGGLIYLDLVNRLIEASSYIASDPSKTERATTWAQGGTNVALPDHERVNNWACSQTTRGPRRDLAHRGDVVVFNDDYFAGFARAYGLKFWIDKAQACYGAAQSWYPDGFSEIQIAVRRFLPGAFFVPFTQDPENETIERPSDGAFETSVIRNLQAGPTWDDVDILSHDGPKPYPTGGLDVDTCYCYEGTNDNGEPGVWFLYSHQNAQSVAPGDPTPDPVWANMLVAVQTYHRETSASFTLYTGIEHVVQPIDTVFAVGGPGPMTELTSVHVVKEDDETNAVELTIVMNAMPAVGAEWDNELNCYVTTANEEDIGSYLFAIHPQFANDTAIIRYKIDQSALDEAGFYAANIAIHTLSLPGEHEAQANKGDRIWIRDENGMIAAMAAAAGGYANFVGKTIQIRDDGIAHHSDSGAGLGPVVRVGGYSVSPDTVADANLTETTDYLYFGAAGVIFGVQDLIADDCLIAKLWAADRQRLPRSNDFKAMRKILERVAGE